MHGRTWEVVATRAQIPTTQLSTAPLFPLCSKPRHQERSAPHHQPSWCLLVSWNSQDLKVNSRILPKALLICGLLILTFQQCSNCACVCVYLQVLFLESKEEFGLLTAFYPMGKLQTLLKGRRQTPTQHSLWQRPNTQTNPQEQILQRWRFASYLIESQSSVIWSLAGLGLWFLPWDGHVMLRCKFVSFPAIIGGSCHWSPDRQPCGQLSQSNPRGRTPSHPHLHRRQRRYGRPHHRCLTILTIQLPPLL